MTFEVQCHFESADLDRIADEVGHVARRAPRLRGAVLSPLRIHPACAHHVPSRGVCGSPSRSECWWWTRWVATQKIGPPSSASVPHQVRKYSIPCDRSCSRGASAAGGTPCRCRASRRRIEHERREDGAGVDEEQCGDGPDVEALIATVVRAFHPVDTGGRSAGSAMPPKSLKSTGAVPIITPPVSSPRQRPGCR